MKRVLVIDSCVRRGESRTRKLLERALETLKTYHGEWEIDLLTLMDLNLKYWNTDTLAHRDGLLAKGEYEDPVFSYGHQFREADGIVIAAPFWDLSIPAMLKVYIENISADGLTFGCNENGLYGICKGKWLLFLTTRGSVYENSPMEMGSRYMEAMSRFFGIDAYYCVCADGLDAAGADGKKVLEAALEKTEQVCRSLSL